MEKQCSHYGRQFEVSAECNGWTNQEKATALILTLRGKACEFFSTIPGKKQGLL